ncbi:DUF1902 domain-containing protein [Desulfotignum balticum]
MRAEWDEEANVFVASSEDVPALDPGEQGTDPTPLLTCCRS